MNDLFEIRDSCVGNTDGLLYVFWDCLSSGNDLKACICALRAFIWSWVKETGFWEDGIGWLVGEMIEGVVTVPLIND